MSQTRKYLSLLSSLVLSLIFITCTKSQSPQLSFNTGTDTFLLDRLTPTEEGLIGRSENVQLRIRLDGQTLRGATLKVTPTQNTPGITTSWVAEIPADQVKLTVILGKVSSVKLTGEVRMAPQTSPASFTGGEPPMAVTLGGAALAQTFQKVPSAK